MLHVDLHHVTLSEKQIRQVLINIVPRDKAKLLCAALAHQKFRTRLGSNGCVLAFPYQVVYVSLRQYHEIRILSIQPSSCLACRDSNHGISNY